MSDSARDRSKLWLTAFVCGAAGFVVGLRFTFTVASPVDARLPAVEKSVTEIDAILSVRAESLREQAARLPATKEAPRAAPARVVAPPVAEPVRSTKSTEEIRVEGVDFLVLFDDVRNRSSFPCSWKFTVTNYGKQPFESIATFHFVDRAGADVTFDAVNVYVNPGETRTYRDLVELYESEFRRVARTEVSFQ